MVNQVDFLPLVPRIPIFRQISPRSQSLSKGHQLEDTRWFCSLCVYLLDLYRWYFKGTVDSHDAIWAGKLAEVAKRAEDFDPACERVNM